MKVSNKILNKKNSRKGFTLIELMVSIAILSILSLFIGDFFISISRIYLSSLSARSAEQNLRVAIENVSRYIKQSREVISVGAGGNDSLSLKMKDDKGDLYAIIFVRQCQADTYNRDFLACGGSPRRIGLLNMEIQKQDNMGNVISTTGPQSLTSGTLNVEKFQITSSPGIPIILNVSLEARIDETSGALGSRTQSFERGAGGQGLVKLETSASLKGQYY